MTPYMTPLKSIRAKCLDCVSQQPMEVRLCPSEDCPLWPYRMGHNPNRKGIGGFKEKNDDDIDGGAYWLHMDIRD